MYYFMRSHVSAVTPVKNIEPDPYVQCGGVETVRTFSSKLQKMID